MNSGMENISNYANVTLGKVPETMEFLGRISEDLAVEQFRENQALYLGRKSLEKKLLALTAIAVSAANGQKDSVKLHFNLAMKFGAGPMEILDALKVAKMALMSSTMSTLKAQLPIIEKNVNINGNNVEIKNIISRVKAQTGMQVLPDNLMALSKFSFDLFSEHLKEKSELMSPFKLGSKFLYLIAYAVSVSIHSEECALIYLKQLFKAGGSIQEIEDALAVSRFITGNRAFITSSEILEQLAGKPEE